MSRPYESDAFQNSATFTVAITYTVAGGARWETARRRARKVAEKLCDAATRMAGVVEVTARVGERSQVPFDWSEPVWFRTANSGRAALSDPNRLERWVDPERELARQALAADRAAADRRREDDRRRRRAVGCPNALPSLLLEPTRRECSCVYCDPQLHLMLLSRIQRGMVLRQ